MVAVGANLEELEALAGVMERTSNELGHMHFWMNGELNLAKWLGPHALEFQHRWSRVDGPALHRCCLDLDAAASRIRRNAEEQRQASAAGTGSSTSTGATTQDVVDAGRAAILKFLKDHGIELGTKALEELDKHFKIPGLDLLLGLKRIHDLQTQMDSYSDGSHNFANAHIIGTSAEQAGAIYNEIGKIMLLTKEPHLIALGTIMTTVGTTSEQIGHSVNAVIK